MVAVTYNNLACCLKRKGKLRTALQYLEKARGVEELCGDQAADVPGTLLNMSTILSELGRHNQALVHAERATQILQQEIAHNSQDGMTTKMSLLGVAYHNVGVEREHCGKLEEALAAYEEGMHIAIRTGSAQSSMAQRLKESHAAVKKQLGLIDSKPHSVAPNAKDLKAAHGRPGTGAVPSSDGGRSNALGTLYDQLGLAHGKGGAPVLGPKARDMRDNALMGISANHGAAVERSEGGKEGRRTPSAARSRNPYGLLKGVVAGGARVAPKGKFRPHSAPLMRESSSSQVMLSSLPQAPLNSQAAGLVAQASATAVSLYRNTLRGGPKRDEDGPGSTRLAGRSVGGRIRPHSALELQRGADAQIWGGANDSEVACGRRRLVGPGQLRLDGLDERFEIGAVGDGKDWQHSPTAGTLLRARRRPDDQRLASGCDSPARTEAEEPHSPAAGTLMMAHRPKTSATAAGSGVNIARSRRALAADLDEIGVQSGNNVKGDCKAARKGPQTPREQGQGAYRPRPKREAHVGAQAGRHEARGAHLDERRLGGDAPKGLVASADMAELYMTERRTSSHGHGSSPQPVSSVIMASPAKHEPGPSPGDGGKRGEDVPQAAPNDGRLESAAAAAADLPHPVGIDDRAAVSAAKAATPQAVEGVGRDDVVVTRDASSSLCDAQEQGEQGASTSAARAEDLDRRSEESWEENKEWLLEGYKALRRKTLRRSEHQRLAHQADANDGSLEVDESRGNGGRDGGGQQEQDAAGKPLQKKKVWQRTESDSTAAAGLDKSSTPAGCGTVGGRVARLPKGKAQALDIAVQLAEEGLGLDSSVSQCDGTFTYTSGEDSDTGD